jgi:hypothetical protein
LSGRVAFTDFGMRAIASGPWSAIAAGDRAAIAGLSIRLGLAACAAALTTADLNADDTGNANGNTRTGLGRRRTSRRYFLGHRRTGVDSQSNDRRQEDLFGYVHVASSACQLNIAFQKNLLRTL